ncbi:MAG: hypothetical protein HFH28_03980 [Clostridiaceae bacterium]|nr:hypothetical protein [Clostridiaceae bacterium]
MIKAILENSVLWRALCRMAEWYRQGAIAAFFRAFREAYPSSRYRRLWRAFCSAPLPTAYTSAYTRAAAACRKWFEKWGAWIRESLVYRGCIAVWKPVSRFFGGGLIGSACRFLGLRGLLLIGLAMYLPIDYFLRSVVQIGFLASGWDEGFLLLCVCYLIWHTAMGRAPIGSRVTPVEGYLWLFIGVGFFLMCAVSPIMSIAIDGLRAEVQYLLWFFIAVRLIEDDRDFGIFYGAMVVLGACVALHGVYQYIAAVPIPASWTSATEQGVRTRVFSITGSPNICGALLVLIAPLAAGIAYYCKKTWAKVGAICLTGLMCLSILFTFSKGAWGGLVVAIIVFACFLDRRLLILLCGGAAGAVLAVPSIANRITYLFTADYVEASQRAGRMVRWETGLRLLEENNPLMGFGLGRFGGAVAMQNQVIEESETFSYFYMDNYYLKTLVEMGYIGLFFYLLLLFGLVIWCLRAIGRTNLSEDDRTRVLPVALFSGMAGVLVHCYFENIFEVPYMMAYFWVMGAAILYAGYFRKRRPKGL